MMRDKHAEIGPLPRGTRVYFDDYRATRTGTVITYGRSATNPYTVYLVTPDDGRAPQVNLQATGESFSAVEVHPDHIYLDPPPTRKRRNQKRQ